MRGKPAPFVPPKARRGFNTYRLTVVLLQHLWMLELWSKVDAHRRTLMQGDGGVVAARVEVSKCASLALAVLEEENLAAREDFETFKRFVDLVLVFVIQMTLELDQRLKFDSKR